MEELQLAGRTDQALRVEMINETNRAEVVADLVAWLGAKVKA